MNICLDGYGRTTKTSVTIIKVPAEMQTLRLLNTSLEHYHYIN
jgi:hypothetical protein